MDTPKQTPDSGASTLNQTAARHRHRRWWLLGVVIIAAIVIIGGVVYWWKVIQNSPVKTVYSYSNVAGTSYQVKFYKGATVKKYSFFPNARNISGNALVSPVEVKGGVPLALSLGGYPNNLASLPASSKSMLLSEGKDCSVVPGSKNVATITITSLHTSAVLCDHDNVYYYSYVGAGNTLYSLELGMYDSSYNAFLSTHTAAEQKSAPPLKDVEAIFSSFTFVSAKRS